MATHEVRLESHGQLPQCRTSRSASTWTRKGESGGPHQRVSKEVAMVLYSRPVRDARHVDWLS
eukprot:9128206-Pyramimonas_sp.AAC.1